MLEFLFRICTLVFFVAISFGIGPAIFSVSSFLGFLLVVIFAQQYKDDVRQYAWLIVYGIIADGILGVTFGVHAALYLLCALLLLFSSRKITSHHITSKTSLDFLSILIIICMTVFYEMVVQDITTFLIAWKNILIVIFGIGVLYIPLQKFMDLLEKLFHSILLSKNYKKHR